MLSDKKKVERTEILCISQARGTSLVKSGEHWRLLSYYAGWSIGNWHGVTEGLLSSLSDHWPSYCLLVAELNRSGVRSDGVGAINW